MDIQVILIAVAALAILGFVLALLLFVVSKRFAVKEDPDWVRCLKRCPVRTVADVAFLVVAVWLLLV